MRVLRSQPSGDMPSPGLKLVLFARIHPSTHSHSHSLHCAIAAACSGTASGQRFVGNRSERAQRLASARTAGQTTSDRTAAVKTQSVAVSATDVIIINTIHGKAYDPRVEPEKVLRKVALSQIRGQGPLEP